MSIEGIGSTRGASLWEILYNGEKKDVKDSLLSLGSQGGDTAIFSAEALRRLEDARHSRQESANGDEAALDLAESTSGTGGAGETQDTEKAIEEQIKALQKKMVAVQESPLPEDTKVAQIGAIQSQISALEQELSKVKLAKLKG